MWILYHHLIICGGKLHLWVSLYNCIFNDYGMQKLTQQMAYTLFIIGND